MLLLASSTVLVVVRWVRLLLLLVCGVPRVCASHGGCARLENGGWKVLLLMRIRLRCNCSVVWFADCCIDDCKDDAVNYSRLANYAPFLSSS